MEAKEQIEKIKKELGISLKSHNKNKQNNKKIVIPSVPKFKVNNDTEKRPIKIPESILNKLK